MPFIDKIGFDKGYFVGYTSMILSFLLVFFGIRSYRENVGKGEIGFFRGFAVGILITLISSVFYVLTWELVCIRFMPDFWEKFSNYSIQKLQSSGASAAAIEAKRQELERFGVLYSNPFFNSLMTFIEPLPVGFLITIISALILRKKAKAVNGDQPLATGAATSLS